MHAAHEAGIRYGNPEAISSVVVCSVPDEETLRMVERKAVDRGIKTVVFEEEDIGNEATALATEPIAGAQRKVFSNYPLWKVRTSEGSSLHCHG